MLGICTALFTLRAIFRLLDRLFLRMKTSLMCFCLALLHSTNYFSCVVHNLHLVLWLRLRHLFSNPQVCDDFNGHNTEWLCPSHSTDVAGLFCQEFAMVQDLTQIVDFPTCIPEHQPYLLDLFLCSNPTLALLLLILLWENLTIW